MPTRLALLATLWGCSDEGDPEGDPHDSVVAEDGDGDGSPVELDCDDADETVYPGAPDVCGDDRVTDCDRESDDGLVTIAGGESFTDLAKALAAATEDDEVRVCAGRWVGVFVATTPIRLVAHAGRELTTLDAVGQGTTLAVPGGSAVIGFTITGGDANESGGGLLATSRGELTVADCRIADNRAYEGGGLALAEHSAAVVSGTIIEGNRAELGGGGILAPDGATIDLTGSVVSDNTATGGGGIALYDGTLTGGALTDNVAEGDSATGYGDDARGGGGLWASGDSRATGVDIGANESGHGGGVLADRGTLVLTDVAVHDNLSDFGIGGGIAVDGATVELRGTTEVVDNVADSSGGGIHVQWGEVIGGTVARNVAYRGGGIGLTSGSVTGTVIRDNSAGTDGGGLYASGPVELFDVIVEANEADSEGGGLALSSSAGGYYGPAAVTVVGGALVGNSAARGGGISLSGGDLELEGTTVSDNTARVGGGFQLAHASALLRSSTVVRNQATSDGGGADLFDATLASVDTDWGADLADNLPEDVRAARQSYAGYAAGATFACDPWDGCTP